MIDFSIYNERKLGTQIVTKVKESARSTREVSETENKSGVSESEQCSMLLRCCTAVA